MVGAGLKSSYSPVSHEKPNREAIKPKPVRKIKSRFINIIGQVSYASDKSIVSGTGAPELLAKLQLSAIYF
jgi:hypothetical protein